MRIGIDARLWHETGVGRYIRNLVWNLQELDKKNEYVLFVQKGITNQELQISDTWRIIETNIKWHTVEEQVKFPKILYKENLDLVHFPYFSVPIAYSRPFVITIHDLIINHYPTGKSSTLPSPLYYLKLFGYNYVIKQGARKAEQVITVSQATKDEIIQHLSIPEDKITVTYEGVGEKAQGSEKTKPSIVNDKPYFLYVGNAYPHKNLERLVEAFTLVVHEFPDVKLIFIGKEDYFYQRLKKKVINLGIEQNILFANFVFEEELRSFYAHAQALILPSLMEGFGLTGLEAMREGCLVLASAIPSLKEIYQDAAIYFDPLAVESLHATIREVLTKKKSLQSFISKGKSRVTFFSWEKMAKQTLKIYEGCLSVRSN